MDGIMWTFFEKVLFPAVMVLCVALVGATLYLAYITFKDSKDPNASMSLLKREWVCTESHYATSTTYVLSGKAMVPITSTRKVCDQWSRK